MIDSFQCNLSTLNSRMLVARDEFTLKINQKSHGILEFYIQLTRWPQILGPLLLPRHVGLMWSLYVIGHLQFEWYMPNIVLKKGYQKDMHCDKIELALKNI